MYQIPADRKAVRRDGPQACAYTPAKCRCGFGRGCDGNSHSPVDL